MPLIRSLPTLMIAAILSASLSGCIAAAAIGAGASAGVAVAEERGVGGSVDDFTIRAEISRLWFERDVEMYRQATITISEGRVLLTGVVTTEQARDDAARLARQVPGVREIFNEIQVRDGGQPSLDQAGDLWIQQKMKTRLLGDSQIRNINYAIDVTDAVIYLVGIAQNQAELDRVIAHARDITGVRRVVSHVVLKSDPRRTGG